MTQHHNRPAVVKVDRGEKILRLEAENDRLKREIERLGEKLGDNGCKPPAEFFQVYEDLWDRAFGKNKRRVHENTNAGAFSLRRRSFCDLCRDDRALDDIMVLDKLFRALPKAVYCEGGRRNDAAEWHKDIGQLVGLWKERYRTEKKGA